jgi:DNA-binding transcriptional MerR regulator
MAALEDRRYGIAEVSTLTDVPIHTLRRWDQRFKQLKPRRDRANRRYYSIADIEIIRRIKRLLKHDKMTTAGASKALDQELYGEGRPKTQQELLDLVDTIETDIRTMLDILDRD